MSVPHLNRVERGRGGDVYAIDAWPTNGHLIVDVAKLGYMREDDFVLDATFGKGTFWTEWQPAQLWTNDLHVPIEERPTGGPFQRHAREDVCALPDLWRDTMFDVVVFDPPYKLNGTPTEEVDARYGVGGSYTSPKDRLGFIIVGTQACALMAKRTLLVKCQDQVVSGDKVWQTDHVTGAAESFGFRKVDRFDFLSCRPQPKGRTQRHSRSCSSQLLVFERR